MLGLPLPLGIHSRLAVLLFGGTLLLACPQLAHAQQSLRVVTWNVSAYDTSATTTGRLTDFRTAIYGVNAANGLTMAPDVFIGQEFMSQAATTDFLTNVLNGAPGSPGDWAAAPFVATSGNGTGLAGESAFFYRTSKVQYLTTTTVNDVSQNFPVVNNNEQPRNTYRYDFQLTADTSQKFGAYSVHMKSSTGASNEARRQLEADRIRRNAQGIDTNGALVGGGLPNGYHYLVAGDFNIASSSETAYQTLTSGSYNGSSVGAFFDPIKTPGNWDVNNNSFRFVHTQDPVSNMDSRFDQILLSPSLVDGTGTDYKGNSQLAYSTTTWNDPNHSYRAWGNDGTSWATGLTTTNNGMVGSAIATALKNSALSGGHLPVFLDINYTALTVPEPGTLALAVLGLGVLVRRRRPSPRERGA